MKKIVFYIAVILTVCLLILPATATDIASDTIFSSDTESELETVETTVETTVEATSIETEGDETLSEIDITIVGEIVNSSNSFSDAVLAVAEYLGVSVSDAEKLINNIVILGDKYLANTDLWALISADITEHPGKYTLIGLFILIILALVGFLIKRVLSDMVQIRETKLKISQIGEAIQSFSQTFKNIEKMNADAVTNEEVYAKLVAQKEENIETLSKQIKQLEEENVKERRSMLIAESYNLQVLKLICDRTALPLSDKSAISLYFTKAQEAIKGELGEEDIKKIDEMAASIKVGETVEKS